MIAVLADRRALILLAGLAALAAACTARAPGPRPAPAAPAAALRVVPSWVQVAPGGSVAFRAAVGATSPAVGWRVVEGGGGSVGADGRYQAPGALGTYHVVATGAGAPAGEATAEVEVAAPGSTDAGGVLPADRATAWNPGLLSVGGIPVRTTVCGTVPASALGNGAQDATAAIQAAIDACPDGQVVQLSAGTFRIDDDIVYLRKGVTLRGAGAEATTLRRTNGATPGSYIPDAAMPVIIVGPNRWSSGGTAHDLAGDGAKGAFSAVLASAPAGGLSPGQIVLVDELSGAAWQPDSAGRGQIWASPDFRVVYQRHLPAQPTDDPWPDAAGWFSRQDRVTAELKEVASWEPGTRTVTFTSPFHIDYRASHGAQLYVFAAQDTHVKYAGVEDLRVQGGDDGQVRFERAAYSWAARIENTGWLGEGFAVNDSFRVEIRDSYVHTPVWFEPGGGSYNISLASGSSEILVENNISVDADKVMVARCAGAGSVVGYNHMDDGHIGSNPSWIEIGLNASHMVGPHHVLFEGNYGFNWDSDKTHGNSILHTVYRNHLRGVRRGFPDAQSGGPLRCAGAGAYSYWHAFVGNVLGLAGQMAGWAYEDAASDRTIWKLGWDDWAPYPVDAQVSSTAHRHGNFDYLTDTVHWEAGFSHALPRSLYRPLKPAFFGKARRWPWVEPTGADDAARLGSLPAKDRFDAGTPFAAP